MLQTLENDVFHFDTYGFSLSLSPMMKLRLPLLLLIFTAVYTVTHAQVGVPFRTEDGSQIDPSSRAERLDSSNVEVKSLPPKLYMWRISDPLGRREIIPVDTIHHLFQNTNLTEGLTGHYNHLGNLGAPRLSRIFFQRTVPNPTIFIDNLSGFFTSPYDFKFTNSNVPYTNLTYFRAGNKVNGEERFKSYFSVNANKRLAFGFSIDYLYGRGLYNHQNTAYFHAGLFGSYIGDRYQLQAILNNNTLKTNENGGIADDRYITAPEEMAQGTRQFESNNIPTILQATTNHNQTSYLFLNHRYNIGFHRTLPTLPGDTLPSRKEYVPVTGFIHTLHLERSRHRFNSADQVDNYYAQTYLNPDMAGVRDSSFHLSIKNTVGISLLEGFNKYAKAGLTAFASHKLSKYYLMGETADKEDTFSENEVYIGGELAKRQGKWLHYRATGEFGALGQAIGQFKLTGEVSLNLPLWKDTITLSGHGDVSNRLAPFHMRHYHSKHFWWDNDLEKEFRTRIRGKLLSPRWGTHIEVGAENIKNYTYFNSTATPQQFGSNIQVLAASWKQNLHLGAFHLDNEVVWQRSTNTTILPLPQLSLYHNFYIQVKLAKKVLSLQLGADVRYFSRYDAPAYMPAIQQFHLQPENQKVKIGGYPLVNVYANFHLKRTRFFVMMYHVNQGSGNSNYFLVPHYPMNPRLIKFGLSWNMYD